MVLLVATGRLNPWAKFHAPRCNPLHNNARLWCSTSRRIHGNNRYTRVRTKCVWC